MKPFRWNPAKNDKLKAERGISFDSMVIAVESGGLLDVTSHPNSEKYPRQHVLVVAHQSYVYLVPYIEEEDYLFLKTIIPSRKATRDYLTLGDVDDKT